MSIARAKGEDTVRKAEERLRELNQHGYNMTGAHVSTKVWLGVLISLALIGVSWAHTFLWMFNRWFPGFETAKDTTPLMKKLTGGHSYYTHGPLVPLVSIALGYVIYRRVGFPSNRTKGSTRLGIAMLCMFALFHLASLYARVHFVSGFALIGVFGALVLTWGGWSLARAYWLPFLILIFMVPFPMEWISKLNYNLKYLAGSQAVWLTNEIFNIPTFMKGATVILPPYPDGSPKHMVIENVCGGLRSLIALTFFASLFALVCRVKGPWRVFMLLLSMPAAVGCNVLRITSLNVVAHHYGVDAAAEGAWFHDLSGLFMFAVALAFLFSVEGIIIFLSKRFKRQWVDEKLLGFLDKIPPTVGSTLSTFRVAPITILVVVLGLSIVWGDDGRLGEGSHNEIASLVTKDLVIDGVKFRSRDLEMDQKTLTILENPDYVLRRFYSPLDERVVDLMIVFSRDNRKATHPPEVCLEGSGGNILSKTDYPVTVETLPKSKGNGDGLDLALREVITKTGDREATHTYIYKCGNSYTVSFFKQQVTILFNGMLSRNASGALIRFTVPVGKGGRKQARELTIEAAKALIPDIDLKLP